MIAGVLVREEDSKKLEKLGVKDSKLLTKEKREELFGKIKKIAVDFQIKIISPEEIDGALKSASLNLNWLEAKNSAGIIGALKLKPDKIFIDCPSVNIIAYKNYFLKRLEKEMKEKNKAELVVEHKADLNYVVVGAASILAKVTRDREIELLKEKGGVDFGSGYLTDEKTQRFLKENFGKAEFGGLFRQKWAPYEELVKGKEQKRLGEF